MTEVFLPAVTLEEKRKACKDLIHILQNDNLYINGKGYYTKVVDLLLKFGYYKNNESITEIYPC